MSKSMQNPTKDQMTFMEDQLINCHDLMTKEEMIDWFVQNEVEQDMASFIVYSEYDKCAKNPFYNISWDELLLLASQQVSDPEVN